MTQLALTGRLNEAHARRLPELRYYKVNYISGLITHVYAFNAFQARRIAQETYRFRETVADVEWVR